MSDYVEGKSANTATLDMDNGSTIVISGGYPLPLTRVEIIMSEDFDSDTAEALMNPIELEWFITALCNRRKLTAQWKG